MIKRFAIVAAVGLAICAGSAAAASAATLKNIPVSIDSTASGSGFLTGITRTVGNTVVSDYTTIGDRATGGLRVGVVGSVDPPSTDFTEGADNYGIGKVYGFRIGRVYDEQAHFETRDGVRLPVGNCVVPYTLPEKIVFLGQGLPSGLFTLQMGSRVWSGSSGAWRAGGYEGTGWVVTPRADKWNGKNQVVSMALVRYERISSSQTMITFTEKVTTPFYNCTRTGTEFQDVTTVDPYFSLQTIGTGSWAVKPAWVWVDLTTIDDPYVGGTMYATGYIRQSLACQTSENSATLAAWGQDMADPSGWAARIRPVDPSDESSSGVDLSIPESLSGLTDQLHGFTDQLDSLWWFLDPWSFFDETRD